jgi:signal transduction histidine kinase/streptogramin lyase
MFAPRLTLLFWVRSLVIGCFALWGGWLALGADLHQEFQTRIWTKENGLPDNRVNALLQTRDGYIWIATPYGLVRFDGVRFTRFTQGTHPEMGSDLCLGLAEDSRGRLWIACREALLRWDGTRFLVLRGVEGHDLRHVGALVPGVDGEMYAATGSSILRLGAEGNLVRSFQVEGMAIRCMEPDQANSLWIGGFGSGVRRLHLESGIQETALPPDEWRHAVTEALHPHRDGSVSVLLVGQKDSRHLATFSAGRWEVGTERAAMTGARPGFLLATRDGSVWLPNGAAGLVRRRGETFDLMGAPWGDHEDFAFCSMQDREGNLWFGLEQGGLVCLTSKRLSVVNRRQGLPSDMIRSLWPANEGRGVWAGTDDGLALVGPDLRSIQTWREAGGEPFGKLKAVVQRPDGSVWFGVDHDQWVFRDGTFTRHHYPRLPSDHAFDDNDTGLNKVRCFLPARDGSLWMAVARGLHRITKGDDRWFTTTNGLGADDVRALLETRDGTVWAGTSGGGLSWYTGNTNKAFSTLTRRDGLSRDTVWALMEDRDGILWAGTDGGLNRLQNGRITTFDRRQGLPEDAVNSILEDDLGYLWIGHDHGLYRVDREELTAVADGRASRVHCVPFGIADGMPIAECNGQTATPAACKTADGRLWFATPKGILVVNPRDVRENDVAPSVVIERVVADEAVVYGEDADHGATPPLATDGPTRLEPGHARFLEFHFTANTFISSETARFRHRLEGYEERWHEAGPRRFAQYIGVPPGDYRFQVVAANHHDVWNPEGASFAFSVAPFFWQTGWFRFGTPLLTLGLLAAAVRWRLGEKDRFHQLATAHHAAEERLAREQELARERARIARNLHDDVGASLVQLRVLVERLDPSESSTAAARETARRLVETVQEANRLLRETLWTVHPADETVAGLADRLCALATETLTPAEIAPRFEVQDLLPSTQLSAGQRREFVRAFREVLTNVVKHAGATEVHLEISATPTLFRAVVRDNGGGFDTSITRSGSSDGGHGLQNIRSRLADLGGSAVIDSTPGQGTRVTLDLPLAG